MISDILGLIGEFFARSAWEVLVDLADILLVAIVLYRVLLVVRGTRAMQMGVGLLLVFMVYQFASSFGLLTLYTMLNGLLTSAVLIVVVVFQHDIRRALTRMGGRSLWFTGAGAQDSTVVEHAIKAAGALAQKRIGALIVFERDATLDEFIQQGTLIEAKVTKELLYGMFIPSFENPLHDGAAIIREGRLWQAGVFLPMSTSFELDRSLGARHRAALGITEETDAVALVVSEERGSISLCFNGNVVRDLDAVSLRDVLPSLLSRRARRKRKSKPGLRTGSGVRASAPPKRVDATPAGTTSPGSNRTETTPE